jgi:hypothetical protein
MNRCGEKHLQDLYVVFKQEECKVLCHHLIIWIFLSQSYYQGNSYVHEFLVDEITVSLSLFDKLPSYIYYAFFWWCVWFIMYIYEQDQCFFSSWQFRHHKGGKHIGCYD